LFVYLRVSLRNRGIRAKYVYYACAAMQSNLDFTLSICLMIDITITVILTNVVSIYIWLNR
jgi:hypothetical protein